MRCKRFCEARGVFRYTSRTVSYAKELTSVPMCYSQGNGINTPLSRLLYCSVHANQMASLIVVVCVRLRSWSSVMSYLGRRE